MNAILLASVGVIILLVGVGAGFWIGRSGIGGGKARIEKAETELEDYKRSVTEHFGQTAAHFQAIGQQYRELYEHMSNGAQALCEPGESGQQLLFAPGAQSASNDEEGPVPEAVVEVADRPPVDYAESPVQAEAEDVTEPAEESASEPEAGLTEDAENTKTDEPTESVAEAPTDSPPDAPVKDGEHTLH